MISATEGGRGKRMPPNRENVNQGGRGRDARRWKFTVFVDNLPQQLDQYGLKGIFKKAGTVSDVYIPFRKTRRTRKFGFVCFWSQGEPAKSILILNNSIVRECKVHVSMVKYEKRRGQGKHSVEFFRDNKHNIQQIGKVWRKKNEFHDNSAEAKDLRFN